MIAGPGSIRARDLGFRYAGAARPAIAELTFEVEAGQVLLVVGPSGSGKSTLGLAVAGLVPREFDGAFQGSLEIDGVETRAWEPTALAARIGVVFQDPETQLVMERVEDDVAFGLENRGWLRGRMLARVPESLVEVGLDGLERRRSTRLSGGQQQRLALGGVLAALPGILVLDEPTANLDPDGASAFFGQLAAIRRLGDTTIVLVEHRVDAAWPLADHVLAIGHDGRPIDVGGPDEVLKRSGVRMRREGIWLPERTARSARAAASLGEADRGAVGAGSVRPVVPPLPAPQPGPALLEAHAVRFGYDPTDPVVRDIELVAGRAERIALVGPNGSGKSTLGRLLVGLLRPDRGIVRLGTDDPWRLSAPELARRAGYVFQDPESQFLADTVEAEVMLGLRDDERAVAGELMERLGLPLGQFAEHSPYRLSGGEARRLSLACVLVRWPQVLVLDEPTFGQDRHGHETLVEILRERLETGTCLFTATHDRRFVDQVADRVVELDDGWIVADTAVNDAA
jgi:energy-coupling factor transport system ATP-binding protein